MRSDVPPLLGALVHRLLAKQPVERPPAGEVLAELANFTAGSNLPRLVDRGRFGNPEYYDDNAPTQAVPNSIPPAPIPVVVPPPVPMSRAASLLLWAMVMSMFAASFVVGLILIFRQKG